jgi:hypothetical protein
VSSFNKNAAATSSQLHPSSSSTKAFARRVGFGVIADNLINIGRAMEKQSQM